MRSSSASHIVSLINEATRYPDIWYHGTEQSFDWFSDKFIGAKCGEIKPGGGLDQEGPGHYFTTSEADARRYGPRVFKVRINFARVVPETGRPLIRELETAMRKAPRLDLHLTNWDEDPKRAFRIALDAIVKYTTGPRDAFLQVWIDFFRHDELAFIRAMKSLGYTGCVIDRVGCQHAIIYDLAAVTKL